MFSSRTRDAICARSFLLLHNVKQRRTSSRPASHTLSPRAGRGWGEGASPPGSELRRSESRRGPLTLHSASKTRVNALTALDLSPHAGRGEKQSRSRDAIRTRVIVTRREFPRSPHRSSPENAGGGHRHLTIRTRATKCKNGKKARKRNADRRVSNLRTLRVRRAQSAARSPLGVPPRLSAIGSISSQGSTWARLRDTPAHAAGSPPAGVALPAMHLARRS
jgi:hypothetical protein